MEDVSDFCICVDKNVATFMLHTEHSHSIFCTNSFLWHVYTKRVTRVKNDSDISSSTHLHSTELSGVKTTLWCVHTRHFLSVRRVWFTFKVYVERSALDASNTLKGSNRAAPDAQNTLQRPSTCLHKNAFVVNAP